MMPQYFHIPGLGLPRVGTSAIAAFIDAITVGSVRGQLIELSSVRGRRATYGQQEDPSKFEVMG